MQYILLAVVIAFVLFTAWRDREARLERAEVARQHARERSELLTRIAHPELVVVPADEPKQVFVPDAVPEQDDFAMVGQVFPGSENAAS
jgi:hypothetical protein